MPRVRQNKTIPLPPDFVSLPTEPFFKQGRSFKLIKREGNVALYDVRFGENPDWASPARNYEVVIIRQVLKGRDVKGYYMPPHEELPSDAQWGTLGWSPFSLADAERKFDELVTRFKAKSKAA